MFNPSKEVHAAASSRNLERLVELLNKYPRLIDVPDDQDETLLYKATANEDDVMIATLVYMGSRVIDYSPSYGLTPLHKAAKQGNVKIVELLVRLGSTAIDTIDYCDEWTPLSFAAHGGHVTLIETLVRLGSPLAKESLRAALKAMSVPAIKTLHYLGVTCPEFSRFRGFIYIEREAAVIRLRVYFEEPLLHRLLRSSYSRSSSSLKRT